MRGQEERNTIDGSQDYRSVKHRDLSVIDWNAYESSYLQWRLRE